MNRPIQCAKCIHLYKDDVKMRCGAFSGVIPAAILGGTFVHDKPYHGQKDKAVLYKEKQTQGE